MTIKLRAMMFTGLVAVAMGGAVAMADDAAKQAPTAPAAPKAAASKAAPKPAADKPAADKPAADKPVAAPKASGASAEIKAGTGVEKHEIVGDATTFPADTVVWVWTRILDVDGKVVHIWKRDGKEIWRADLPVGSHRWSTSSRRKLKAGSYEVEVQTADGASLGTVAFTVT
jgi:hypothetical protein